MPEFLDIKHLDAGYGRSQVLFDVNLGIPWRGGLRYPHLEKIQGARQRLDEILAPTHGAFGVSPDRR